MVSAYNLQANNDKRNRMSDVEKNNIQLDIVKELYKKTGIVVLSEVTSSFLPLIQVIDDCKVLGLQYGSKDNGRMGTYVMVNTTMYVVDKINYIDIRDLCLQKIVSSNRRCDVLNYLRMMTIPHPIIKIKLIIRGAPEKEKITLYGFKGPIINMGERSTVYSLINEVIAKSDGTCKIIIGDLNLDPRGDDVRYLAGTVQQEGNLLKSEKLKLIVPSEDTCYNYHHRKSEILDYAISNRDWSIDVMECGFNDRSNPSDHKAIIVALI